MAALLVLLNASEGFAKPNSKGASSTTAKDLDLTVLPVVAPPVTDVDSTRNFSIGISSTNYLGQGQEGRAKSFSSLDLQVDSGSRAKIIDSRLKAQGSIGLNDSDFLFVEIPEAYFATSPQFTGNFSITAGRKLETWNTMDSTWGFGAWNPRFRWDYLRPQEVAMVGLSASYETSNFRAVVFGSPVFIPDRGAPLDFADGRVRSISPWVLNPPSKVEIANGKVADIKYRAEIPETSSIVLNPSFSSLVRIGGKKGAWTTLAYAYKPMNSLLISYEAGHNNATLDVDAVLYPRVAYHHLASADIGFQGAKNSISLSFLADLPRDKLPDYTHRTTQVVDKVYILSPTYRYSFSTVDKDKGALSLSYLKRFGAEPADLGEDADGTSSFDSRYPYSSAFLAKVALPKFRHTTLVASMLVDIDKPGVINSWYAGYEAAKQWNVFLSADVLTSWSNDLSSFIYRYRANDRFMGGVSYVF